MDGGGIKGILPARVALEIESRSNRYLSACFDLIGGTSAGAIIAGALVMPSDQNDFCAKFKMWDILKLFTT